MTRHGLVETTAADASSPATDTRAFMAIADADMRPTGQVPGRQHSAEAQRSGLSVFTSALPCGGRADADIGHCSKSP